MKKNTLLLAAVITQLCWCAPVHAWSRPSYPTEAEKAKYADARAIITTRFGTIVLKFFPEVAPLHVKNFIALAEGGYYNSTSFYRVVPGSYIQGGGTWDGPGYTIPAEFSKKKHLRGILSMSRNKDPDSAGSQFFIQAADDPSLDGAYSVFGEVIEGLEVVDTIASVPRDANNIPRERVAMEVNITYGPRPSREFAQGAEYSCRVSGNAVATADFRARGKIVCPISGNGSFQLFPDGSLKESGKAETTLNFPFKDNGADGSFGLENTRILSAPAATAMARSV